MPKNKDSLWTPNDMSDDDNDDSDEDFNDAYSMQKDNSVEAKHPKKKAGKPKAAKPIRQPIELSKDYYYTDFGPNEKKKAIDDVNNICIKIIKEGSSKLNLDEFKNILVANKLYAPHSHVQLVEEQIKQSFKTCASAPNALIAYQEISDFIKKELYMVKPLIFEPFFFPSIENEDKLVQCLCKVKKTIDICMYTITNKKIIEFLNAATSNGIAIRIISDDTMSTKFENYCLFELSLKHVPVRLDNNANINMHNKFVIIDHLILITGSFNWTNMAAQRNQENFIIVESQYLIQSFQKEFDKLWEMFEPYQITESKAKEVVAIGEKAKKEKAEKRAADKKKAKDKKDK